MNQFEGFPKIPRYSRNCVITEKIDGTNAQIVIEPVLMTVKEWENTHLPPLLYSFSTVLVECVALYAGSRKRFISPEADNFGFASWAAMNFEELLKLGPGRHYGEWWGQGIQRGYGLKEKRFSLFNTRKWNDPSVRPSCCHVVPTIVVGEFDTPDLISGAMSILEDMGSFAAPGFMNPEGIVIYHTAANQLFKKTFKNDEKGKEEGDGTVF